MHLSADILANAELNPPKVQGAVASFHGCEDQRQLHRKSRSISKTAKWMLSHNNEARSMRGGRRIVLRCRKLGAASYEDLTALLRALTFAPAFSTSGEAKP